MDESERSVLKRVPGSYTAIIADVRKTNITVIRDQHGMMPGVIGFKDGTHIFASEDCAFTKNNIRTIEDALPGSIYLYDPQGGYTREPVVESKPKHCAFTWTYTADIFSTLDRVTVRTLREILGEKLAEEFPLSPNLVTFNPRSPEPAARTYASRIGAPFIPIFYKQTTERSFQGADESLRTSSIKGNLHINPTILPQLQGKSIVVVDDSIIRGTVTKNTKRLLEDAGVKDITCLSYMPRIGDVGSDGINRGCHFGIDMPPTDNFVARGRSTEEISNHLGVKVGFLSLEGLRKGFKEAGMNPDKLCTYCLGGEEPFAKLTVRGK